MKKQKNFYAYFNYIDAVKLPKDVIKACHHAGDCQADVENCMLLPEVKKELAKINPERLKEELGEYGAWSEEELNDHQQNLERILWIAAGNIQDENPTHFN